MMRIAPNSGNMDRMGSMDAPAFMATRARDDVRAKNRAHASVYSGAASDENFAIIAHELCFIVPQSSSSTNTRLQVLTSMNGRATESTRRYGTNPEHNAMHREAARAEIRYVGVAVGSLNYVKGQVNNGVTVAFAGLNTIVQGSRNQRDVTPGDLIIADVAEADEKETMPDGYPVSKLRLQAQAYDPKSTAESMQTHIRYVLDNPSKWRAVMGERMSNTNAWMTAVKRTVDSYLFAGVMGIMEAMNAGLIQPTAYLRGLLTDDDKAIIDAANAELPNLNSGDQNKKRVAIHRILRASTTIATYLADFLKVIAYSGNSKRLSAGDSSSMSLFRIRLAQRIFHSVSPTGNQNSNGVFNVANEFGFAPSPNGVDAPDFRGRHVNRKRVRQNDPYGETLSMQHNHFKRAATAISHAQQVDFSFIIGKSTTGSRPGENMVVSQGICRP